MNLARLLDGFAAVAPADDRPIAGVAMDHRQVVERGLFLACAGERGHGLDWLQESLARGASAVAWEPAPGRAAPQVPPAVVAVAVERLRSRAGQIAARHHGEPSARLEVVGVTGTNGKTSVSHLVAHALGAAGRPCGVVGTLGHGLPGRLAPADRTTPDAVTVQALLSALLADGASAAAMEVSSHALAQARVAGVRFRVAVFTNLSHEHLDYHGDLAAYGAVKRRLFETDGLPAAVICSDDAFGRELLRGLAPAVAATAVGTGAGASPRQLAARFVELRALDLRDDGIGVDLESHAGRMRIDSPLLGRFNALNLALAAGVLLELGMTPARAADALARVPTVPGRMEAFRGAGSPLVIVDYAHTPDALEQVLRAAREHTRGTLWCVFGCGGERDRAKRPLMAAAAAAWSDRVIVTDDNPRGEDAARIVAEVVAGFPAAADWRVEHGRARAIDAAIGAADTGDVVVVAGKGHEDVQWIGGRAEPFSDRATVAAIVAGRLS